MDIHFEYERLRRLASTDEGWQRISKAWLAVSYSGKSNAGDPNRPVVGFAIDSVTKRCAVDHNSANHARMYDEMVSDLEREECLDFDEALARVIRGWSGKILDFEFPIIFMGSPRFSKSQGKYDWKLIGSLEEAILSQGVGLPLTSLHLAHAKYH